MPASLLDDLHPDGPDEDLLDPVSRETGDDFAVGPFSLHRLDAPFAENGMSNRPRTARRSSGRGRAGAARRRPGRRDNHAAPRRTPPDGHGDGLGPVALPRGARPPGDRAAAEKT